MPPPAHQISIAETLELLDTRFAEVARGVAQREYALWLGSGISLNRVVGVKGVIERVLEYLRERRDPHEPDCRFDAALTEILRELTDAERAGIDLGQPVIDWGTRDDVLNRLAAHYSQVLDVRLEGEDAEDFLLWVGVDVPNTFAIEEPDVEHLCVILLAMEGAVTNIASSNWDYLIEAAERELTGKPGNLLDVCIRGADFQAAAQAARLLKFHGCAERATLDPGTYRKLLIARESQIVHWPHDGDYAAMKHNLVQLAHQWRTLMVGFSAQDRNIQDVFDEAEALSPWGWPNPPTPHVFAEETLSNGQKIILKCVYRDDYQAHRADIEAAARLPAYGKPLLLALFLHVLEAKFTEFLRIAAPAVWAAGETEVLAAGLRCLRDRVAAEAEPDRLIFLRKFIQAFSHTLRLHQEGRDTAPAGQYQPLTSLPLQQTVTVPPGAGLRQTALALGVLGCGEQAGKWTIAVGDVTDPSAPPITAEAGGRKSHIFFAANDDAAVNMISDGLIVPDDDGVVVILSASPGPRRQRSPLEAPGRSGRSGLREVSISTILQSSQGVFDFVERFEQEASL